MVTSTFAPQDALSRIDIFSIKNEDKKIWEAARGRLGNGYSLLLFSLRLEHKTKQCEGGTKSGDM